MKFKKLKSSKMSEAVTDQVLKLIKDGSLKAGDKLPIELELAASLGISRTAVREGMARLHAMNVIEVLPGRGTFISKMPDDNIIKMRRKNIEDKDTLLDALEFRKVVESGMIELVVKKITNGDLKNLKECIEKHKKGLTQNIFPAEGDMLFHKTLAQATHNKMFIEISEDIYILIMDSVLAIKNYKNEYKHSLDYHERIYNSLLKKDENSAKEAMREHIDGLIKVILES